ncbi:MAG TPA: glycogen debranching protein GlgX [Myxococcales bacterium]|nr:glycogen debranching protein GlgX [Myxococcales bacterium]
MTEVLPGSPEPLGATFDGRGVNFAVYADEASGVEVCIFDATNPSREVRRYPLGHQTHRVWHGYVPGLAPGTLYGYRVTGPVEPQRGLRFNPSKLLVDPYARALTGQVDFTAPVHGYKRGSKDADLSVDTEDDAHGVPKGVVVVDNFDWGDDRRPAVPWKDTVLYEAHVKGFTRLHPEIPPQTRGTYAGLGQPQVIRHLQSLGVTAVELLPVHECVDEGFLHEKGLRNYWGYSTLSYFAPAQRYSCLDSRGGQVNELKWMVKELHRAGIEVILDVVYNHTCEGNQMGPTLCWRGLANRTYYHLKPDDPRYYLDFTGTGNSLNLGHPQVLKLVMDSLRHWASEYRVDGFRFDLATTLGRARGPYDPRAPFFQAVHQDPVLSRLKLIAEPWDVGEGGYQVANFPLLWSEWNDRYRDCMRRFWKGEPHLAAEMGYRLTGSSDQFLLSGRKPSASINYVTCHDGFTLHDLCTYEHKHNEANQEGNRDGTSANHSWNAGVEGETDDPRVQASREQQKRNHLATLFLSVGVPMLLAGDELSRTQRGNNNAYCQDNELSWMDWTVDDRRGSLLRFTRELARLRRQMPVLRRQRFFKGEPVAGSRLKDVTWFRADGAEMSSEDWHKPSVRCLGMMLGGDALAETDAGGRPVVGDTLLVLLNGDGRTHLFALPQVEWGGPWELLLETADPGQSSAPRPAPKKVRLPARSLAVLRRAAPAAGGG